MIHISPPVADTIFGRAEASFCEAPPRLVETTRPVFPLVALAQVERNVAGDQLLALIEEAETREARTNSRDDMCHNGSSCQGLPILAR